MRLVLFSWLIMAITGCTFGNTQFQADVKKFTYQVPVDDSKLIIVLKEMFNEGSRKQEISFINLVVNSGKEISIGRHRNGFYLKSPCDSKEVFHPWVETGREWTNLRLIFRHLDKGSHAKVLVKVKRALYNFYLDHSCSHFYK